VAEGSLDDILKSKDSLTGKYLRGDLKIEIPEKRRKSNPKKCLEVVGGCEHNLKNITAALPREKMVVITGLSGSGKSTLAFDILFAEGQRRYLETLTPYVRQYVKIMDKPNVDVITGISPTVAIEQRMSREGKRSTVATVTEIYHFLRLLYTRLGRQYCPSCEKPITMQSPEQIQSALLRSFRGKTVSFFAPKVLGRKGFHKEVFKQALKNGYTWARVDGTMVDLTKPPLLNRYQEHTIEILIAQEMICSRTRGALKGTIRESLKQGGGTFLALDGQGEERRYSETLYCPQCTLSFEPLDPRLFSFNSTQGACPQCEGMGFISDFDPDLIVTHPDKSLREGAVAVLEGKYLPDYQKKKLFREIKAALGISSQKPFGKLKEKERQLVLYGEDNGKRGQFMGIIPSLRHMLAHAEEDNKTDSFSQFMRGGACSRCRGKRLKENALAVKIQGLGIWDVVSLSVAEAERLYRTISFPPHEEAIGSIIVEEINARLKFLLQVGLSYLTLNRRGDTLSGGESQRIRLAAQLGSNLRGACYILDEPTIGLHPRDNQILIDTLKTLRDAGNSVVVVEHDEATIRQGDFIVDLGPGGGIHGGDIVAAGSLENIKQCSASITGHYLSDQHRSKITSRERSSDTWLTISGAREHNLKNIDATIPLGTLLCVTGVSGSGKSTLLKETIFKGVKNRLQGWNGKAGTHGDIKGWEHLDRVLEVDHAPIGRTPRSTPATYVGLYGDIRKLFSMIPEARMRGYKPGRFSFNEKGGRC